MPPRPRQRTKLTRHPAEPEPAPTSEEEAISRGRAGDAHPGAQVPSERDAGVGRANSGRSGAQVQEPNRAEPESADSGLSRTGRSGVGSDPPVGVRRVAWTPDAKTMRAELTAWSAARRKAAERAEEVRGLIADGRVPVGDARMIVVKVAEATGEPVEEVARAAGLPADIEG